MLSRNVDIEPEERLLYYRIHYPAFFQNFATIDKLSDEQIIETVSQRVQAGLLFQAEQLHLPINLKIALVDIGKRYTFKQDHQKHNKTSHYKMGFRYVDFATPAAIKGSWAVGSLNNKGFGRISRINAINPDLKVLGEFNVKSN